jgi:putative DNA methylase
MKQATKLIEVALPLDAINRASAAEKQPGIGAHPRGLHLWWARRPLAAARAVIFAQMVDDPSAHPDLFPTEKTQEKERQRLFKIVEDLVLWENRTNEEVLQRARKEIWQSWRYACAANADHPRARELFDRDELPAFHDPFAGGGALPLEAQRLSLEAHASDLNPVAVLICKAMIEIPPRFAGRQPVNPPSREQSSLLAKEWQGAQGLAEDVRYYGQWIRDEAEKRIGQLYPNIEITAEMVRERPDLKKYAGKSLRVIAWLWARTVKSPNPAFADVDVPLASTFMLSTKAGKEAYVQPVIEDGSYRFKTKVGKPADFEAVKRGTKAGGSHSPFLCLMSGVPMPFDYLRTEARAGRMGGKLMAVVAEGDRGRVYLSPSVAMETVAGSAAPYWKPEVEICHWPGRTNVVEYGLTEFGDLFTPRQLVALTTFSDLVQEARERVADDALAAGLAGDDVSLDGGGMGAAAYADAVSVYLAFAIDRLADYNSTIATWKPSGEQVMQTYKRQALPMTWDFPESNVLGSSAICWANAVKYEADNLNATAPVGAQIAGVATQQDACQQIDSMDKIVSTDPPYYDNIGYGDLSDFFYVWLRRSLKSTFPSLFSTVAVPKVEELIATPYRHGGKETAEEFFLDGMTRAMGRLAAQSHPGFPVTIYYAFKQSESDDVEGTASTGWDTFLEAVIRAGFAVTGTWPMRTELGNRMIGSGTNALASSIVLVCRPRLADARTVARRDFIIALKAELPTALAHLQRGNIAPVDLAQAAIGPGMAVFTRYASVLDAEGNPLSVRQALALINQTLDEALAEQDGDFDSDTRWALAWFEQFGFAEGEFGVAETLSKAKNTSVAGMVSAGVVASSRGKVRLLRPDELPVGWNPATDLRLTAWEVVHHLIRALESGGESSAATLIAPLGANAEVARELAYRLYTVGERKKRAVEARSYNGLVQSWPEINRLAREAAAGGGFAASQLFGEDGE